MFNVYRKLMDGLRCIDDFTTKCLDEDHRAYFNTLYTGTTQVIMDLCQTGEYQTGDIWNFLWHVMKTKNENRIFGNVTKNQNRGNECYTQLKIVYPVFWPSYS